MNILSFRKAPDSLPNEDTENIKRLLFEQLRREMNLSKMLEILTETGEGARTFFSPFLSAKEVCGIAEEFVGRRGGTFAARLSPTGFCCRGAAAEYASALAAMVAFAGLHAKDGRLWAEGVATDRAYKFGVRFVSDLSRRELEALLCGGCGGDVRDVFLRADLLYIRCIADNALWDFGIDDDWRLGEGVGRRTGKAAGVSVAERGVYGEAGPQEDGWAVQNTGEGACGSWGAGTCGNWGTGTCGSGGTASLLSARKRGAFDITLAISAPLFSDDYVELKRPTAAPEVFAAIRAQLLPLLGKQTRQ